MCDESKYLNKTLSTFLNNNKKEAVREKKSDVNQIKKQVSFSFILSLLLSFWDLSLLVKHINATSVGSRSRSFISFASAEAQRPISMTLCHTRVRCSITEI